MVSCGLAVFLCQRLNSVKVPHGGRGVMVWAGIRYGQQTQLHFIDGILNAQTYRDKTLRLIVVPLICRHHLLFQHENARLHVARICTHFLAVSDPLHMTAYST
jgi:hypothetical protein